MNITGNWKGIYTYGDGYPYSVLGKSEPFEFNIIDNDGTIYGSCINDIVKAISGNEAYIIGTFKGSTINFKKRYKIPSVIDENGNQIQDAKSLGDGIDYTGRLRNKLFSKKTYFSGKWVINIEIKDHNNKIRTYQVKGTWEMSKVE